MLPFFTGNAEITIDAKQRLSIPAKFRSLVEAGRDGVAWIAVPYPGGIIRLYTESGFRVLAERGEQTLTPDEDVARLQATLFGLAERIEPDSVHRITLPKTHLELTGLGTDVVVLGAGDRLEVRDRAVWKDEVKTNFGSLTSIVRAIEDRKRK
jgi:MraZ protein